MNFWPDFIKLKTAVGGNREQRAYEETFDAPLEERLYITMPNRHIKRILSQLEFAIRLNEEQGGCFDGCVGEALESLLAAMDADGVLTKTACMAAEQLLLPCADAAKEYKLILAGHAHIDMDWMWSYQETVAITLSTFRTVLNLMAQYPQFCFSQSQASVYKIVEEYDPDMMTEIQARIREGRWEVTASAWVETDKNMPNTESLVRHIQYTRNYLSQTWGIDPDKLEIDFSPDTFGHSANIPEIDAFGGVKYMYHCRALDGDQSLYRWQAPSGRELLVYREQYWYNSGITPKAGLGLIDVSRTCGGFKTGLVVYGVGDHGGGPTRRDIEAGLEMQKWPVWPRMEFGTFARFFHEAESVRDRLPLVDRELNMIFAGCYTTQSRIKQANRRCEDLLTDAEAWTAFSGRRLNAEKQEQAWQNVLYSHFHDLITGSCVQESRENAMGQFSKTLAYAQTQFSNSVGAIAAMIDTSGIETDSADAIAMSEGAGGGFRMGARLDMYDYSGQENFLGFNNGVPNPERGCGKTRIFHIFNSAGAPRRAVTEITVWDWVGDTRRLRFTDARGNVLRHQLVDEEPRGYWAHRFHRVLVEADLPAMGYTTVVLTEATAVDYPVYRQPQIRTDKPFDDYVLENEYIRTVFDARTGYLKSMVDKQTGSEYLGGGEGAGLFAVTQERITNSAWKIGRYIKSEAMEGPVTVDHAVSGPLQQRFTATYRWGQSRLRVTPMLQAGEKALRFAIHVEWNEVTGPETAPLLQFRVPLGFRTDKFLFDVPAGVQYRAPENQDLPGLRYGAAIRSDGTALALIPDCKYGYRACEDSLAVSLINTSNNPDAFPERGFHIINLALAIAPDQPQALAHTAAAFDRPAYFLSANAHRGTLPLEHSFLDMQARTTVLSAVIPTVRPDTWHLRYYETAGREETVTFRFAKPPVAAVCVDARGQEVPSDVRLQDNAVTVTARAFSLGELRVRF